MMELREKKKISGAEWKRFSIKLDPFLSVIPVIKFSGSHSSSFTSQVFYGREERGRSTIFAEDRATVRRVWFPYAKEKKRKYIGIMK